MPDKSAKDTMRPGAAEEASAAAYRAKRMLEKGAKVNENDPTRNVAEPQGNKGASKE